MPDELTKTEREELDKLRADKKSNDNRELFCRVSQKGACSLYGLGRFPVTLYKEQWEKIFPFMEKIKAFIKEHETELSVK